MQRKKKIQKKEKPIKGLKKLNIENPLTKIKFSQRYFDFLEKREKLQINKIRSKFLETIKKQNIIIIKSKIGSGKTTQIPQFLIHSEFSKNSKIAFIAPGPEKIIFTAKRVAIESDTILGEQIGYSIDYEDFKCNSTFLNFFTVSSFFEKILEDEMLMKYSVLILDDFEMREFEMDFLVAYLKILEDKRKIIGKDLKIVILINNECQEILEFFGDREIGFLEISDKKEENVEVFYSKKNVEDFVEKGLKTIFQIFLCEKKGDILFFLPNYKDCIKIKNKMLQLIEQYEDILKDIVVISLFNKANENEKKKIYLKNSKHLRKIIFTTEIAEISFFVDNITFIIDSGMITKKIFNFEKKIKIKKNLRISSQKANLRKNLLKKKKNSKIFRLYTEETLLKKMNNNNKNKIKNSEISKMLLFLKKMGINDIINFDYIERPSKEAINFGIKELKNLGALKKNNNITELGKLMSFFPLNPKISKMLIKSKKLGVSKEVLNGLCLYLSGDFLVGEQKEVFFKENENSDFLILSEIILKFEESLEKMEFCHKNNFDYKILDLALKIKWKLKQILFNSKIFFTAEEEYSHLEKKQKVILSILSGFKNNVAFLNNSNVYKIYNSDKKVKVFEKSALKENTKFFVFMDSKEKYVKNCCEIDSFMIGILFPNFFNSSSIFKKDFIIEE